MSSSDFASEMDAPRASESTRLSLMHRHVVKMQVVEPWSFGSCASRKLSFFKNRLLGGD